jgi:hypothetical protein
MSDHTVRITGTPMGEDTNALFVRSGASLFEIPRRFVLGIEPADRHGTANDIRLTLADDAVLLQRVEPVEDHRSVPGIRSNNGPTCNCACNCNCARNCACACSEVTRQTGVSETNFRQPVTDREPPSRHKTVSVIPRTHRRRFPS